MDPAGDFPLFEEEASWRRAPSLRLRLLLGIAFALILPLTLFGFFGNRELGRSTTENLIQNLLPGKAEDTAERIQAWLNRNLDLAILVYASLFEGGDPLPKDFDDWRLRVEGPVSYLGDPLILSSEGEILFQKGWGGSGTVPEPVRKWVSGIGQGAEARFLPPTEDPFGHGTPVTGTRDPSRYRLPLLIPLRDDRQVLRGACLFLLPFAEVQAEVDKALEELRKAGGIGRGEVFLVDRREGRYLLHTDRRRIFSEAEGLEAEGFEPGEDGMVQALSSPLELASLSWIVGVRGSRKEFFFASVAELQTFFWVLVILVLATTLGVATFLSLAATRSLRGLEEATEELGAGRLDTRAPVGGPREVRKLAGALNAMAAQLEAERERLKQAERDRAWTHMARQVAHEIKNPLQPMRLHGELIRKSCAGGSEEVAGRVSRSAEVILRQVDALQRIVGDFSAFAQAGEPPRESQVFEASGVLDQIVSLYEARREPEVRILDRSEGARLRGSPLRLQQVFVNLVNNALEASEGGGGGPVEVEGRSEEGFWVAEVRDRGLGLPPGVRGRVFDPYYSTKKGGTGLGLAICRRSLEAMGGRIEVLPREGGGALARVAIPLVET